MAGFYSVRGMADSEFALWFATRVFDFYALGYLFLTDINAYRFNVERRGDLSALHRSCTSE
jgi:hypothetical protein